MTPEAEADEDDLTGYTPSTRNPLIIAAAGALLGCIFAAVSTSDFIKHLDHQVHEIHCSFIPGAGKELGESGCKAVMMSPYSSFFRESVWGGLPVSLWALAVYAFLAYRALVLLWRGKPSRFETRFLFIATLLPLLMTVIYAFLSISKVGETCKICVGLYASSVLVFVGALFAHQRNAEPEEFGTAGPFALAFGEGVAFVAVLTVTFLIFTPNPDPKKSLTGCGTLVSGEDPASMMIPLRSGSGEPAIEVLDPLCPSCKAFDIRLSATSLRNRLELKAVLFPLDNTCNWMVTEAIHPGACAVSEALLCAAGLNANPKDEKAVHEVLAWAFKHQDALRILASKDEPGLRAKIEATFPNVKGCLGSALVRNKLTKGLRWAVANAIPVLTPQLFVGNSRLCDEDADLGLEYTLSKMLSPEGRLARAAVKPPPRPVPAPAPVAQKPTVAPTPEPAPPPPLDEDRINPPSEDKEESEP